MSKKCDKKCDNCSSGKCSHAEGFKTKASGDYSHSEGYKTIAAGIASHAQNNHTRAEGNSSTAEGCHTVACGNCSHAEGSNTQSKGCASHAEGEASVAEGFASHAEGVHTIAANDGSHAEGYAKEGHIHSTGHGSHAEGFAKHGSILATREGAHAEGTVDVGMIQATNQGAHAEGFVTGNNINDGLNNILNPFNISNPQNQFGVSVQPQTLLQNDFTNGVSALTGTGAQNTMVNSAVNNISAITNLQSVNVNGINNFTTNPFLGQSIFPNRNLGRNEHECVKAQITAAGKGAHAEGLANQGNILATGEGAHAEGLANLGTILASGIAAHAEGINTVATGLASHARGIQALATQRAQYAASSGALSTIGDNQNVQFNLKIQNPATSTRPVYTFTNDGSGVISPFTIPIVPDNTSWTFHALIIGRDNGVNIHSEIKNASVSRASGNTTIVVVDDVPDIINIFGNPASFTQLNVDTATGGIVLQATPGLINGTYPAMRWHAHINCSSVTFPSVASTICTTGSFN